MRVAIVVSSSVPGPGSSRTPRISAGTRAGGSRSGGRGPGTGDGAAAGRRFWPCTLGRFPAAIRRLRLPVAPGLWERLRLTAGAFDLVDVHSRHGSIALAVACARPRRLVFTPGASVDAFLRWPARGRDARAMARADRIVCRSEVERDLIGEAIPAAASRTRVISDGVDLDAMREAEPYATTGAVVLAVDRLDRGTWVDRAIASVPSLPPEFWLVVVGDGPSRGRLAAYAADLRVSSRVRFVGAVPDAVLYRWLRTARVVVTLGRSRGSRGTGDRSASGRRVAGRLRSSDQPGSGRVPGRRARDLRLRGRIAAGCGGRDRGGRRRVRPSWRARGGSGRRRGSRSSTRLGCSTGS